jgi:hypothetical protein
MENLVSRFECCGWREALSYNVSPKHYQTFVHWWSGVIVSLVLLNGEHGNKYVCIASLGEWVSLRLLLALPTYTLNPIFSISGECPGILQPYVILNLNACLRTRPPQCKDLTNVCA